MSSARRLLLVCALALVPACTDSTSSGNGLPQRTFRMGFSAIPPKNDQQSALAALEVWTRRADAAIMHVSVPYKSLLTGTSALTYVTTVDLPLANYYRGKHLQIFFTADVTDGLNRAAESPDLVSLGRSITDTAVQRVYRDYMLAVATQIRPDYLGFAAETNLIRDAAPDSVYTALVQMTNAAANDVLALSSVHPTLYVSVQADEAWGAFLPGGIYQGVETDFTDFPFTQALGVSSYPYFVYPDPDDVPLDYYVRLLNGRTMPLMVVEGGWTSGSVGSVQSTPEKQARYLRRQEKLLDSAKAVATFQLSFTDFDISSFPPQPPGSVLPLFAQLGLVDVNLVPKAALATYDSIYARRRSQ